MNREQILKALNDQNSIENMYCIEKITNEDELKSLQEQGYQVYYTKKTWENAYPKIPSKYVYCTKSILFSEGLSYLDIEHGIFIPTYIYEKNNFFNKENYENILYNKIQDCMKLYKEKKYDLLLCGIASEQNGNIVLAILSHLLENESPCEELYEAFFNIYTLVESGVTKLSEKAIRNLFLCKSVSQDEKTKIKLSVFEENISLYRGQGSHSTSAEKAMSWTTDKCLAAAFAFRNSRNEAKILTGIVKKDDVLEYVLNGHEKEMIVKPGTVAITQTEMLMPFTEYGKYVRGIENYVITNSIDLKKYNKDYFPLYLVKRIFALYDKYRKENNCHDAIHSCRVALHACALFTMSVIAGADLGIDLFRAFTEAIDACVYHDIGRTTDDCDVTHGERSYHIYKKDNGENQTVKFLIENHCRDDEMARKVLETSFTNKKKQQRIWNLYGIIKDADALDRVRFGFASKDYISYKYLHNSDTVLLIGVATGLLSENFRAWFSR